LYAVASIVFGLLAIWHPLAVVNVLLIFLAAWLIVAGIYRIVFAIRVRKEIRGEWMIALSGVLAVVLGVLFAAYPVAGLLTVAIWIGAAALVYGVLQVIAGVRMHRWKRVLESARWNNEKGALEAPFSLVFPKAQLRTSKSSDATCLPLSEITTLYLPLGHAFGFCTLNVVMAGPSVAMVSEVLLKGSSLPSI
jgi:hypothetical protein